jgi:hypothetical protein
VLAGTLVLLGGTATLAFNPGTDSRASATASTGGSTTVCEGGVNDGVVCNESAECTGGSCSGVSDVNVVARGHLTIIMDTQPLNMGWADTSYPVTCSEPSAGTTSDCEHKDNSLLTLVLEFTLNGEAYLFAESFKQLPNGGSCGSPPCNFEIPSWAVTGGSQAGWSQQAVESILAETAAQFINDTVKIRWGGLPPAVENAVGAVVGKSPTQRIALSRTDEVPICTDATPCNHGPRNDRFSDHSGGTDVLATVRRYKVDVAVIGP